MSEEIFVDDIGHVEVISGVVRVELTQAMLSRPKSGEEKPSLDTRPVHELIFPPTGFSRSYQRMKTVVDKLIASGAVQHSPTDKDGS